MNECQSSDTKLPLKIERESHTNSKQNTCLLSADFTNSRVPESRVNECLVFFCGCEITC